ncbi:MULTISPECIES: ABC transporter ATP-binding protein [unclassified Marinobacterium]|jgi:glycerol transport system ATP-binding protein|uniref:ABC transporter ATP-binding protein n=1 Tax=unclassified Marinobacterium TaxID=2644139 RepID=UPI0015688AEF|nr:MULTISPECIES: ABC transporter ATP-binding protein [unclassified Marinobacterium]NRP10297.1 sn-glycerol-3-phosphate import ATP-binding protein UgpC [Marinobacterium sp. xm-g-48]NRP37188.1 sn-glycerol-3-phosphate import ATP-binding protein UgpC [Marinobacterium sp. xm-d-579]NRP59669.1 sn-glycerol-3-phosphate import ATP-binding protein UgpC [Marinobacterium sp. xm-d-564]NRP83396.1 sn-glycerol-3-phosphate import ATP-binding protein UgpC [Marinobacterium sp. xm-d-509]NRP95134.1 sn-glycerol-3-pho
MAKIKLDNIRHSYYPNPSSDDDFALKRVHFDWDDGGAYALLGPSGCGKTTLLNIISGLLEPSHGKLLFDDNEVTSLSPSERNIAQVFQFPVIYDTMTVYDNLAFPLRNRGVDEARIDVKVREISSMLEIDDLLQTKAAGLSPDNKQKISLGRGLVREDVNVIMFDEPLTVIDPHLKWKLRSKLKELHQKVKTTMIYVTHDQTEALTFADQVVVMNFGQVLQVGTPDALFERPEHTFVGHFIGSPGMNVLPVEIVDGQVSLGGHFLEVSSPIVEAEGKSLEIGVRPEFVRIAEQGIPATVVNVMDVGRHKVLQTLVGSQKVFAVLNEDQPVPEGSTYLTFDKPQTRLYKDGWLVDLTYEYEVL